MGRRSRLRERSKITKEGFILAESICKGCEHAIFCPTWGEYKCMLHTHRFVAGLMECDDIKTHGKDFEEKPCQCKNCMEGNNDDGVDTK